jgi:DNA-binding transcriptional MerR regulator
VSETPQIPEKPKYKSSEVCQYTNTQPYVLRFWESEFPQLSPERSRGGQPVYRRQDIDLILRIKQLLYDEEYTIDGARERLEKELTDERPSPPRITAATSDTESARSMPKHRGLPRRERGGADTVLPRVPAGAGRQDEVDFDSVPRERYEDAVDEIAHLRLQLREAETRTRKAEALARQSEELAERNHDRTHRAIERLEKLLELLS